MGPNRFAFRRTLGARHRLLSRAPGPHILAHSPKRVSGQLKREGLSSWGKIRSIQRARQAEKAILPVIGEVPVKEVNEKHISQVINRFIDRGAKVKANRLRSLFGCVEPFLRQEKAVAWSQFQPAFINRVLHAGFHVETIQTLVFERHRDSQSREAVADHNTMRLHKHGQNLLRCFFRRHCLWHGVSPKTLNIPNSDAAVLRWYSRSTRIAVQSKRIQVARLIA